jgi:hypothetical protein
MKIFYFSAQVVRIFPRAVLIHKSYLMFRNELIVSKVSKQQNDFNFPRGSYFPLRSYSSQLAIAHNGPAHSRRVAVKRCTHRFIDTWWLGRVRLQFLVGLLISPALLISFLFYFPKKFVLIWFS